MAMTRSADFKTPLCRLSYASGLFKPRSQAGGPEKYSATLIFDKKDMPELAKVVKEVITAEWKEKGLDRAKQGLIKSPFLDGASKEARNKETGEISPGLGADKFFIRVTANIDRPPAVRWKDPNTQETENTVYSGCYGKAVLNCFAWNHPASGDGVSFGISFFQKIAEGEPLGGSGPINPSQWMEVVADSGPLPETVGEGAGALFG